MYCHNVHSSKTDSEHSVSDVGQTVCQCIIQAVVIIVSTCLLFPVSASEEWPSYQQTKLQQL